MSFDRLIFPFVFDIILIDLEIANYFNKYINNTLLEFIFNYIQKIIIEMFMKQIKCFVIKVRQVFGFIIINGSLMKNYTV